MKIHPAAMDRKWSPTFFLLICALSYHFIRTTAQVATEPEEVIFNTCITHQTCSPCIQAHPSCAFCKQENFGEANSYRCDLVANLHKRGCAYENIVNPESVLTVIKDTELSRTVQFGPQEVYVKVRPRQVKTVPVRFRQAMDYPVDLYYLMDLSHSMLDDKLKLATLGSFLASEMRKLTSDFKLGFGSFVDKVVMPYVSIVSKKLAEPCDGCAAPYGYKHHMTLSEDTASFEKRVSDAPISGNLDAPEGSFDAIMQAIACRSDIGWRPKARKLLVLSTDASFHFAGDGKLGGIVTPNDGECHLTDIGRGEKMYDASSSQDYPSLSQINRMVKDHKINVIFAVTEDQYPIYKQLSMMIEGSTAGKLANDSSNVVSLVKDQYNNLTSVVELKDTAPSDQMKVTFFSKCLGPKSKRTNVCSEVKPGSELEWEMNIEVFKCPPGPGPHIMPFEVYPVGLEEKLIVNVEVICQCECEEWAQRKHKAEVCSFQGDLVCGVCECPPDRFGDHCECTNDLLTPLGKEDCRMGNSSLICEGRGSCVCGKCRCLSRPRPEEMVTGTYCECDNFSCDRRDGLLCGGPEHGVCVCGKCVCLPGWTGPDCGCSTSQENCMASNGKICNDKGICVCNECQCAKEGVNGASAYYGPTCENCATCPGLCYTLKACAQCQAFGTGELNDDGDASLCARNCTTFNATHEEEVYADQPGEAICQFRDETDFCTFYFSYYHHPVTKALMVEVKKTKVCPEQINALALILGIILGILGLGLVLLLIWKLLTVIHDRRQFAKFNAEVQNAKWDTSGNPIFRPATNTYKNPVYSK